MRNESQNKSYVARQGAATRGAKLARLSYRLLASGEHYHLLEIELHTGRHHQIRCQLAALGCPIKGDLKYGAPRSNPGGSISLLSRQISFTHPREQGSPHAHGSRTRRTTVARPRSRHRAIGLVN